MSGFNCCSNEETGRMTKWIYRRKSETTVFIARKGKRRKRCNKEETAITKLGTQLANFLQDSKTIMFWVILSTGQKVFVVHEYKFTSIFPGL